MDTLPKLTIVCVAVLMYVCWTYAYDPSTCIKCRKSHVCKAPDCFCCRDEMPLGSHRIPQMVFFTFDDAVNPAVAAHYRDLFDTSRLNPNGCPIRMTLFVSHRSTVYKYVREFYEKGMEIASHSVTHSHPNSQTFVREAKKQKENLAKKAKIPESKIVGWRSPFLEPLGDTQPKVLKELGYEYDATLTMTKKGSNDKAITPFTLDFGWPYDCKIKPCPSNSHNGFWEVPVVSVKDYKNKYDCVYVDACHSPPPTENMAYKFLWDNFQRYYSTNRAPMGINMHASWFYYPDRKAAMDKFIKQLVKMDDVYIVTVKQVIDWLKNPTPLNQIKTFQPWLCNGNGNETMEAQEIHPSFSKKQLTQNIRQPTGRLTMQTRTPKRVISWPPRSNTPQPARSARVNSASVPVIPYAPTVRAVRFWWRPPKVVRTPNQIDVQQSQTVAPTPQLNTQTQQEARLEKERQDVLRQEMIEKQRQMNLAKKAQEEKLKREKAEKQRQEELKRQEELRRQQVEQKIAEEKRRHEQLRQEQIAKQQELKRLELKKQRELQQQKLEEQKRQELARQQEAEKQKYAEQLALQTQQEAVMRKQIQEEALQQNQIPQERQQHYKNQHVADIQNNQNIQESLPSHEPSNLYQGSFARKLDEMLTHSQNSRIEMLQQLSLQDLQLLQSEVIRRMKTLPTKEPMQMTTPFRQDITQKPVQISSDARKNVNEFSTITELPSIKTIELSQSTFSSMPSDIPSNHVDETQLFANEPSKSPQIPLDETQLFANEPSKSPPIPLDETQLFANEPSKSPPIPLDETQLFANEPSNFPPIPLEEAHLFANEPSNLPPIPLDEAHIFSNEPANLPQIPLDQTQLFSNEPSIIPTNPLDGTQMFSNRPSNIPPNPLDDKQLFSNKPSDRPFYPQDSTHLFSNRPLTIPYNPQGSTQLAEETTTHYPQKIIATESPMFMETRYMPTETPAPIHFQDTKIAEYDTTTMAAISDIYQKVTETLANKTANQQNIPFFSARPHEFHQQPIVITSANEEIRKHKEPTWKVNMFDFQGLDGPWKMTPTTPEPTTAVTVKTTKKTSLKLLPVQIRLFSTNDRYQAAPVLSRTAFVRPSLFSPEEIKPKADPLPAVAHTYAPILTDDIAITRERLNSLNLSPRANTPATSKPTTTTEATTTTASTTTSTTTPTTTTTTTTTTTQPTTTTTTKPTTTTATTTISPTTTVATITPEAIIHFTPQVTRPPRPTLALNTQDRPMRTFVPIPLNWHLAGPMFLPSKPPTFKTSLMTTKESGCVQTENCVLPNCACKLEELPKNMFQKEVPQIVYITIDGSLNFHSLSKIRKMFTGRVNPNGCPVKGTMFITDAGSSYRIANLLVNSGIELSMMGMNSRPASNIDELKSGLILQRLRISESANIPRDSIRGWRSPGFKTLGDKQFELLSKLNMYDSSLVVDRTSTTKPKLWPFTLDYGLGEKCDIVPCPVRRHPGVWEVPVMPLLGPDNSTTCEYVDGCTIQPKSTEQTFKFLMDNFNQYYSTNRAPFAIRLKQIWFHWYYRDNLKGLFKFLDTILGYGDVYVTSVSDMLDWVKNPTKVQDINTFESWKCK